MADDEVGIDMPHQDAAFMAAVAKGLMDVEQGKTVGLDEVKTQLRLP